MNADLSLLCMLVNCLLRVNFIIRIISMSLFIGEPIKHEETSIRRSGILIYTIWPNNELFIVK
jgi:hypothetical protein